MSNLKTPNEIQQQPYYPPQPYLYEMQEEEVDLFEYFQVLWKKKWLVLLMTMLVTIGAYGTCKLLPKKYNITATITAPSGNTNKLSGILGQLGGLEGLGSLATGLGGGDSKSNQLASILQSRTLATRVVEGLNLLPVFFPPEKFKNKPEEKRPILEDAVGFFMKNVLIVKSDKKDQTIKITAQWYDAELGVRMLEKLLVEAQDFTSNTESSESKRNKIFIREQLQDNRQALLEASKELNRFYSENRISTIIPQINVDLGLSQAVPKTIEDIRNAVGAETQPSPNNAYNSRVVSDVPAQVYYTYLQGEQILMAKVNALLAQQYELAKIEEIKERLSFQIIDKPFPTKRNYTPKTRLVTMVAFAGGFFLSVMLVLFQHAFHKMRERSKPTAS